MIPNLSGISETKLIKPINNKALTKESYKTNHKWKIVWRNTISLSYIHIAAFYGLYKAWFHASLLTFTWFYCIGWISGVGVTVGAHRLWAHRSYKAKWPMRLILMILHTTAFQDDLYQWVRDHRVHHKFTDTDADPYNVRRGFFFSHMGWLMVRKHPDVISKGATIDCSDVAKDPIVAFQRKWYLYMMTLFCWIIPTIIPWLVWNESLWYSWHYAVCRYCVNLHVTWLVNSVAHIWGMKPYDKSFSSTDSAGAAFVTLGEGWHNYHHVFPWDYKAGEFGASLNNVSTYLINFFVYLGWAYDLKTVPAEIIKKRALLSGERY